MAAARAIIALFVVGLSGAEECGLDAASCPGEDEAALLQSVHFVARMAPEEIKQEAEGKDLWAQADKMWAQADELRAESEKAEKASEARLTNPPAADVGEGSSAHNVTSTGAGDGDLWAQSNKEWAQVKRAEADIDQARKANGSNTSNASSGYVTTVDGVTVFGLVQEAGRMTPEEIKQEAETKDLWAQSDKMWAQADELFAESEKAEKASEARLTNPPAADVGEGSSAHNVTSTGAGDGDLWAQSNKEWAQVKRAEADIDQARKANGSNTSNASSGYVTTVDGVTVFGLVQEAGRMTPEEINQKQADIKHRQVGIKPQQAQTNEASAGAVARMAGDIGEGSNTTNVTRAGAGETLVTDGHHRAVVGDKGSVIKFR